MAATTAEQQTRTALLASKREEVARLEHNAHPGTNSPNAGPAGAAERVAIDRLKAEIDALERLERPSSWQHEKVGGYTEGHDPVVLDAELMGSHAIARERGRFAVAPTLGPGSVRQIVNDIRPDLVLSVQSEHEHPDAQFVVDLLNTALMQLAPEDR